VIAANNHTVEVLDAGALADFASQMEPIYGAWKNWSPDPAVAEAVFNRTLELAATY
jgi:hypothetical protein